MVLEYRLIANQYVLHNQGVASGRPLEAVALAFDRDTGELLSHGEPARVQMWATLTVKRLAHSFHFEEADKLVVITGRLPVSQLNRCLQEYGYSKEFYARLLTNEFAFASAA
jgi:hypothetical protein